MKQTHLAIVTLRCAYCGIEHRLKVEVHEDYRIEVELNDMTCDIMRTERSDSIIERLDEERS